MAVSSSVKRHCKVVWPFAIWVLATFHYGFNCHKTICVVLDECRWQFHVTHAGCPSHDNRTAELGKTPDQFDCSSVEGTGDKKSITAGVENEIVRVEGGCDVQTFPIVGVVATQG